MQMQSIPASVTASPFRPKGNTGQGDNFEEVNSNPKVFMLS